MEGDTKVFIRSLKEILFIKIKVSGRMENNTDKEIIFYNSIQKGEQEFGKMV